MALSLSEITSENWRDCANLRHSEKLRKLYASNMEALAECRFCPDRVPLAIYDEKLLVGMAVCGFDAQAGQGWIHHLMIDEGFQNRGFTRQTLKLLLRRFRHIDGCRAVCVDWNPSNRPMEEFYEGCGFKRTGTRTAAGRIVAEILYPTNGQPASSE